jgi:signal transduction histidine kinase/DNA-binding response OmpR family regulator
MEFPELDFTQYTILAVDDTPSNLVVVSAFLNNMGFEVITVDNGRSALQEARDHQPNLILLDVMMPEMDGFTTCRLLKEDPRTADIPVIFMTALANVEDKVQGFQVGATDYVTKPLSKRELSARITLHLRNQALTRSYRQYANYLETSSRLGRQVTSILDMDHLLHETTRLIQSRFLYYSVMIWLKKNGSDTLTLQALAGRDGADKQPQPQEININTPQSIIANVWRSGDFYLAHDVRSDTNYLPTKELPYTRSEYAIPLQVGENRFGVLDVQDDKVDAFDEEDLIVLRLLADQLAIALQNAILYGRLTEFNQKLEQEVARRTADLRASNAQLAQIDRAKSDFINVASHELFTPIALIKGYTQILAEDSKIQPDEDQARIVKGISRGAQRLHEIVESLLDVARIDNAQVHLYYQPISLFSIWENLANQIASALEERQIELVIGPDLLELGFIEADGEALHKAFFHLLVNAIKYTPDGGRIVVNGRSPTPDTVEITVQDSGIGINPADHEAIFSKFYQTGPIHLHSTGKTKFKGGGPGLGLAIVRGLILSHKGKIWVESPGYDEKACPGSTFFVHLPRYQTGNEQMVAGGW